MKIRRERDFQKAAKIFTDREEPRAAFWKQYDTTKSEMYQEDCDIHVLNYYGIGGIGKSRLIQEIMLEMDTKLKSPRYIYIDFYNCQERCDVLHRMKNQLIDRYKFNFPLFELGHYVYAKKVGENIENIEVEQLTKKSPVLSLVLSLAGNIPLVGTAAKILDIVTQAVPIADNAISIILTKIKKHGKKLSQLDEMREDELYNHLPYLFAVDLKDNLEKKAKEPLVVFFDTYEMLVNELNSVGDPLKNDEWIRNENGIVQNVPNVLWVIGGREKLKWERFNCEWTNALETHLLGNLSFEDSNSFLVNAGVSDGKLCEQLYKLTDGTPVYLDICLDQYLRIYDSGKTPDISMFGKNTFDLIERFVRYMGEAQKDLVYMLACIKKWNNKLVVDLASTILPNFSFSAYEKIKDYSFIVLSDDNNYFIHQTVGNVLMESAPKQLKYLIGKGLSDIFLNTIKEKRPFSSEYSAALFYVVQAGLLMYDNREDLLNFYNEKLSKSLIEFARTNAIEQAKNDFELIYMRAAQNPNDLFYATVLRDKAVFSLIFSDYKIAKKAAQKSTQLFLNLLGENHCETIKAMSVLADTLEHLREHNSVFALRKDILVRYRKVLGDDHPETINAIYGLSNSAEILGRFETAIKLKKTAIKLCNIVFGENHIKSLKAVQSLVFTLNNAKKYDEAIVLSEANLKKSQQILSTYHTYIEELIFHLVCLYRSAGYSHKAINLLQTEYEKRCRDFGDAHPRTIKILNSMAVNLSFMKDYGKALELQQKNLDMCKEFLGDNHPDTIVSMNNLATHLRFQGEYAKAVEMHKETLKRQLIIYEKEHPAVELTMSMMADSYEEMGEIKKAKAIREKIKTLSKKEP